MTTQPPRYEYRFVIDVFSPETLPMARLAEYMAEVADLLGHDAYVHFVKVEAGSMVLVQEVEPEAAPKVRDQVHDVKLGEGPPEARRARVNIDRMLAADNGSGELIEPQGAPVLKFPGAKAPKDLAYGPFNQPGELTGTVIMIGGKNDPVPIHLQDGDRVHICSVKRDLARRLAAHMFEAPIRVSGTGRWLRDSTGDWQMREFRVTDFRPLGQTPLREMVDKLRGVKASWLNTADPIGELQKIRSS